MTDQPALPNAKRMREAWETSGRVHVARSTTLYGAALAHADRMVRRHAKLAYWAQTGHSDDYPEMAEFRDHVAVRRWLGQISLSRQDEAIEQILAKAQGWVNDGAQADRIVAAYAAQRASGQLDKLLETRRAVHRAAFTTALELGSSPVLASRRLIAFIVSIQSGIATEQTGKTVSNHLDLLDRDGLITYEHGVPGRSGRRSGRIWINLPVDAPSDVNPDAYLDLALTTDQRLATQEFIAHSRSTFEAGVEAANQPYIKRRVRSLKHAEAARRHEAKWAYDEWIRESASLQLGLAEGVIGVIGPRATAQSLASQRLTRAVVFAGAESGGDTLPLSSSSESTSVPDKDPMLSGLGVSGWLPIGAPRAALVYMAETDPPRRSALQVGTPFRLPSEACVSGRQEVTLSSRLRDSSETMPFDIRSDRQHDLTCPGLAVAEVQPLIDPTDDLLAEPPRQSCGSRRRGRPRKYPPWIDWHGRLAAFSNHPHYDLCRHLQALDGADPNPDVALGLSLCFEWRHDLVQFVFGLVVDIGLRPGKHFFLNTYLPDLGFRPGNIYWQHEDRVTPRQRRVQYRDAQGRSETVDAPSKLEVAIRGLKAKGAYYIAENLEWRTSHHSGCQDDWLPVSSCVCRSDLRELFADEFDPAS